MGAFHQLVSRGVEVAYNQAGNHEELKLDVPTWVLVILSATTAVYIFLHITVTYAFGVLIPTLTVVEAPTAAAVIRSERYTDEDSPDAPLLSKEEKEAKSNVDEEAVVVVSKPLTAKFKTIMRHLREKTGSRHAHWRGVGGFIIYNIATMWALGFARAIMPFRTCGHLVHIPVAAVLCLLSTAWIQQMIAMPGKNYFERVAELVRAGAFKKLFFPVLCVEILETAVIMLLRQFAVILGYVQSRKTDDQANVALLVFGSAIAFFTSISLLLAVIPANIGLVRLQASLLSEETETVVPMDRTLGGAELKTIKTGWKSFSRDGLRCLARNYIFYSLLQLTISSWFAVSIAVQLYVAYGSQAPEVVKNHVHHMLL